MQPPDDRQLLLERLEALRPIAEEFASEALGYHSDADSVAYDLGYDDEHPAHLSLDELKSAVHELFHASSQAEKRGSQADAEELRHLLVALRSAALRTNEAVRALLAAEWTCAVPQSPGFTNLNAVGSKLLSMLETQMMTEWILEEAARRAWRASS